MGITYLTFLKHMIEKIYVETVYPPKKSCAHRKNRASGHLRNFLAFMFYKKQSRVDISEVIAMSHIQRYEI